jgi:AmmeMemoRadiSam system protein A
MSTEQGRILIPIAHAAIGRELGKAQATAEDAPWLKEPGATFVTLTQQDQLRGCIGSLVAHRPLLDDVKENAIAAAFRDPRFAPLTEQEFEYTEVEVSLLSAAEPMTFSSERDALSQLRPGVDGVIFEYSHYRSTFLPQVWEQLPDPAEFMAHLKHKAGLAPSFWANEVQLSRYAVQKWKQKDLEVKAA